MSSKRTLFFQVSHRRIMILKDQDIGSNDEFHFSPGEEEFWILRGEIIPY